MFSNIQSNYHHMKGGSSTITPDVILIPKKDQFPVATLLHCFNPGSHAQFDQHGTIINCFGKLRAILSHDKALFSAINQNGKCCQPAVNVVASDSPIYRHSTLSINITIYGHYWQIKCGLLTVLLLPFLHLQPRKTNERPASQVCA